MRRGVALIAVLVAALLLPTAAGAFTRTLVTNSVLSPVVVTAPASAPAGKLFIVEKRGVIKTWEGGALKTFLDIRTIVGASGNEQGLLGLAFHPRYDGVNVRRFFVYYTNVNGDPRVAQFRSNVGGTLGVASSRKVLVKVDHPDSTSNHNGGGLAFGPGGGLNIAVGDGGSGCDPWSHAQNLRSKMGKILVIDPDKAGATAKVRFYGLRNPWRFSFDRATHDIWIGDVGQNLREEVDFVKASTARTLRNFGWDVYEGTLKGTCPHGPLNSAGVLRFPVRQYAHTAGRCSITGGYVYRGAAVAGAVGRYFYGDFCTGEVWSLRRRSDGTLTSSRLELNVPHISSFGEDSAGELYMTSLDGAVYELRP